MTQTTPTPSSVEAMREALEPFARYAKALLARRDGAEVEPVPNDRLAFGIDGQHVTIGHLRRAVEALTPDDGVTIPADYVLVPRDLTYLPAMREAGWKHVDTKLFHGLETQLQAMWSAMLSAAPKAPPVSQPEGERLREAAAAALLTLRHARVFIGSREKMHPDGQALYDSDVAALAAALTPSGATEQGEGE